MRLVVRDVNVDIRGMRLLQDINFELDSQILFVLGENGSGKSTLLKAILALIRYTGTICIDGHESHMLNAKQRAQKIAYIPQKEVINLPYSLLDIVLMGRFSQTSGLMYSKQACDEALNILDNLGIYEKANHDFRQLSGGQQQLGLIARALFQDAAVMLFDEPLNALDLAHVFFILEKLPTLNKTIIITSHNPEHCYIADRILMLKNRTIFEYGCVDDVLNVANVSALYDVNVAEIRLPNGAKYFYKQHG